MLVAEPPSRASAAGAGQAGTIAVDPAIACPQQAQTLWNTRAGALGWTSEWSRGPQSLPGQHLPPVLVPIRARRGAEPVEGSGVCALAPLVSILLPECLLSLTHHSWLLELSLRSAFVYVHVCACVCACMCICMCISVHTYVCASIYMCMHVHVHMCMCVHRCVCTCLCVHVCVCERGEGTRSSSMSWLESSG